MNGFVTMVLFPKLGLRSAPPAFPLPAFWPPSGPPPPPRLTVSLLFFPSLSDSLTLILGPY